MQSAALLNDGQNYEKYRSHPFLREGLSDRVKDTKVQRGASHLKRPIFLGMKSTYNREETTLVVIHVITQRKDYNK